MSKLKITVLKKTFDQELADAHCCPGAAPCPHFEEGQEFVVERGRPQDFCAWAWNDLRTFARVFSCGGDFAGWSKDRNSLIRCCTHGVRPVIFNLEWIEE